MAATSTDVTDFGIRLCQLREERGVSLRELGRRTGLSASSLSAIEKGRSSPTLATLQRILQALGTSIGEFFATPAVSEVVPVFHAAEMSTIHDRHRAYTLCFPRRVDLRFEMLREVLATTETTPDWERHDCDVGGILLHGGPVQLEIEGHGAWVLQQNDAFYITAGEKHRARSIGKENAILVTVLCPPRY